MPPSDSFLFAMLTNARARQHHTDAETRYKNVDTNHTQTIHILYTTHNYMVTVHSNRSLFIFSSISVIFEVKNVLGSFHNTGSVENLNAEPLLTSKLKRGNSKTF